MEIAKFVLSCIGSFIAVSGFFAGIWKSYSKKMSDKIRFIQDEADEKIRYSEESAKRRIDEVRQGTGADTEKLEKRIESLEKAVADLQKDVNANVGQRLANIEGTIKGMSNILNQIQGYFISHTAVGEK